MDIVLCEHRCSADRYPGPDPRRRAVFGSMRRSSVEMDIRFTKDGYARLGRPFFAKEKEYDN
jgi:hypothetical protein